MCVYLYMYLYMYICMCVYTKTHFSFSSSIIRYHMSTFCFYPRIAPFSSSAIANKVF